MSVAAILVFLAPLARPVSCDDVWWHTARGREVIERGAIAPSRAMLVDDSQTEADWLGGVGNYLLFSSFGFYGLFLGKIVLGGVLVGYVGWSRSAKRTGWPLLLGVLLLVSCEPVMMLAGRGLDLAFAVLLWIVLHRFEQMRERLIGIVLVSVLWANLGPLSLCGLLIVALTARERRHTTAIELAVATVAFSATPRGWRTLFDAIQLMAPWMSESTSILAETPWGPADLTAAPTVAFIVLAGLALPSVYRIRNPINIATWIGAVAIGLATEFATPMMATLLVLLSCGHRDSARAAGKSVKNSDEAAEPVRRRVSDVAMTSAACAVALLAAGGVGGQPRLGWGVEARLEPRLFQQATAGLPSGSVFALDEATAGVAAWSDLHGVDTNQRALVGGRLREFRLAVDDVSHRRRNRYQRSDGSWGGWWVWLRGKPAPVNWIAVSADDVRTIQSMEETGFRPGSIDSPVIPYASSYVPDMAKAIVDGAETRGIVDRGRWFYQPPIHAGLLFDAAYIAGGDTRIRLRQARVFRAMGLTTAALRCLSARNWALDRERVECYLDLADQERRVAGQPSDWSLAVLAELGRSVDSPAPRQQNKRLNEAARLYIGTDCQSALKLLENDSSAVSQFARARLYLEAGESGMAVDELRRLIAEHPDNRHVHGARDVLRSY